MHSHLEEPVYVLFTTVRGGQEDIVMALDSGANDCMVKPATQREVIARIEALGRRYTSRGDSDKVLEFFPYQIDCANREITCNSRKINITQKGCELALFLFQNPDRLLSRKDILKHVWGDIEFKCTDS